jgi:hypothetical protein
LNAKGKRHTQKLLQEVSPNVHHSMGRFLKDAFVDVAGEGVFVADLCLTNLALDLL